MQNTQIDLDLDFNLSEVLEEFKNGVSISLATLSAIMDKIIDKVKTWQQRPLESIYPFAWLDGYSLQDQRRW